MKSPLTRRDTLKLGAAATLTSMQAQKRDSSDEICFMRAVDMMALIRAKRLSAREVMQAHLKQIERVNPKVNAMVTMVAEDSLMSQAARADESLARGEWLGPLHGLAVAVKDLHETAGIRTTFGSPLHANYVPDFDCRIVQRECP